jgi:hypothetical protein
MITKSRREPDRSSGLFETPLCLPWPSSATRGAELVHSTRKSGPCDSEEACGLISELSVEIVNNNREDDTGRTEA